MAILTHAPGCGTRTPWRCDRPLDLSVLLGTLLVMAAGWIVGASASVADEPPASEYQVKAAFLVNFPKYADWPAGAFAGASSPIVIAVLAETRVAEEIQSAVAGRTVNGRQLVLKRLTSEDESAACHILFISAAEEQHGQGLLSRLKGGVLTVGESDGFLESGGIINLAHRNRRIALEVNLTAAGNAGIKISSKLLSVASVVTGKAR